MKNEVWKDIPGYEGYYQASDRGRIRSLDRMVRQKASSTQRVRGRIMQQSTDKDGYKIVGLRKFGKQKTCKVHRLVALSFLRGKRSLQVNHINGRKKDNRVFNLELVTQSENRKHAYDTGLQNSNHCLGSKNHAAVLNEKDVRKIRKKLNQGFGITELARIYGVSYGAIAGIKYGHNWKHLK